MTNDPAQGMTPEEEARLNRSVAGRIGYENRIVRNAAEAADMVKEELWERFEATAHTREHCFLEIRGAKAGCACGAIDINIGEMITELFAPAN